MTCGTGTRAGLGWEVWVASLVASCQCLGGVTGRRWGTLQALTTGPKGQVGVEGYRSALCWAMSANWSKLGHADCVEASGIFLTPPAPQKVRALGLRMDPGMQRYLGQPAVGAGGLSLSSVSGGRQEAGEWIGGSEPSGAGTAGERAERGHGTGGGGVGPSEVSGGPGCRDPAQ